MSSSMLKLNSQKTVFIIFGSHAQLKKLASHLPVRIFGKLLHPSAVDKNLGVWFDATFSFGDHVHNIYKTCFIQIRDLRQVRQYLTDDAAVLAANTLVSSRLDYCNSLLRSLSSFYMCKLQCIQNTLRRIVTNCIRYSRASPILKNSIGCQLNFGVFSKQPLLFIIKFLHSGHPNYFSPHLSIRCGKSMAQDTTAQIRRFLEVPQFYPSVHK